MPSLLTVQTSQSLALDETLAPSGRSLENLLHLSVVILLSRLHFGGSCGWDFYSYTLVLRLVPNITDFPSACTAVDGDKLCISGTWHLMERGSGSAFMGLAFNQEIKRPCTSPVHGNLHCSYIGSCQNCSFGLREIVYLLVLLKN